MLSEKKGSGCQLTQDSESVLVAQSCQTVEHHGILSMGFSRQEYNSGLPCPSPTYPYPYPSIHVYTHIHTYNGILLRHKKG